ncbi:MAG: hypothetical protein U0K91_11275, partial [Acutalibacteraceae bacterium]|nr:hypothetical protein [Acutalibacteraceae bacterium]
MWWKILLAVLALIIIASLIRAATLKPKKIQTVKIRDVDIDENKVAEHLSDAIKFKTISRVRDEGVEWEEFEKFHEYLDKTYPLIAKNTTKEV